MTVKKKQKRSGRHCVEEQMFGTAEFKGAKIKDSFTLCHRKALNSHPREQHKNQMLCFPTEFSINSSIRKEGF